MAIKRTLARAAHKVERVIDMTKRSPAAGNPIIDCYGGYTTPDGIILRGRVLAQARAVSGEGRQSKWQNFRDFIGLFFTDELKGVAITAPAHDAQTETDEEGFFALTIPEYDATTRSVSIRAGEADNTHEVKVFSSDGATFGVISDIDDTVIRTGAFSLIRNLWTSATGNVHEREVFSDAIDLLRGLEGQGACFFYVSSSPWNLYDYLQSIFARTGLPLGPFFLRDLGISETQFTTGTHGDHKTEAIEKILAANPHLTFTLLGDTGQHDPHIYADIASRHPNLIKRVILRRAGRGAVSDAVMSDVDRIERAGVPATVVTDYRSLV